MKLHPNLPIQRASKYKKKLTKIVCLLLICFCRLPANTLYLNISSRGLSSAYSSSELAQYLEIYALLRNVSISKLKNPIPWHENDKHLEAFRSGKTGFPFIDAGVRQLKKEGWTHHFVRYALSMFLTR